MLGLEPHATPRKANPSKGGGLEGASTTATFTFAAEQTVSNP